MQHNGNVNPFPDGPLPWVWPVNADDTAVVADCKKLLGDVEKHKNCSDKCSLPT